MAQTARTVDTQTGLIAVAQRFGALALRRSVQEVID